MIGEQCRLETADRNIWEDPDEFAAIKGNSHCLGEAHRPNFQVLEIKESL